VAWVGDVHVGELGGQVAADHSVEDLLVVLQTADVLLRLRRQSVLCRVLEVLLEELVVKVLFVD